MRPERQLLFWLAAGLTALLLVALLREVLLPFVVGGVVAYFFNPLADRLERLGLSRTVAAALLVVGVGLLVFAILAFLAPLAANQLRQLSETLPDDLARLRAGIESWAAQRFGNRFPEFQAGLHKALSDLGQGWSGSMGAIAGALWSRGLAVFNLLSLLLITPVVVFYLLVDWHPMLARLDAWLPRDHAPVIRRLAGDINAAVAAFIRGQGTICIILGLFYGLGLSLCGLRYGFLIGLATGILSFVPFVGWALGLIMAGGLALAQTWPDPTLGLKVLAVFLAGMTLDSALLSPKIVGQRIGLHPVWLMFALFAFSYLFGFVGMLVAVPVAAAVGVIVRFALEIYLGSAVYQGGARVGSDPEGTP